MLSYWQMVKFKTRTTARQGLKKLLLNAHLWRLDCFVFYVFPTTDSCYHLQKQQAENPNILVAKDGAAKANRVMNRKEGVAVAKPKNDAVIAKKSAKSLTAILTARSKVRLT